MRSQISDKWRVFTRRAALVATAAFVALLFGCGDESTGNGGGAPWDSSNYELMAAQSCDDIRERVVDSTTEDVLRYRYQYYAGVDYNDGMAEEGNNSAADGGAGRGNDSSDSPDDYTETNVQEEGVDEDDFVKTDGDYIYTVQGDELLILDSWPAEETSIVSRLNLNDNDFGQDQHHVRANSMFLSGDQVAVFSRFSGYVDNRYRYGTRISVVDVSDRSAPSIDKEVEFDGNFLSARMIDGQVYAVTRGHFDVPVDRWSLASAQDSGLPEASYEDSEEEIERKVNRARPKVRRMVEEELADVPVEEMMPERRRQADDGSVVEEPMFACTDMYLPHQVTDNGVLSVTHFDLDDLQDIESTGLMADGWEVYASKDNLYVAMSNRAWGWGWGWMQNRDNETHIHKFALDTSDDKPAYRVSGRVDGWLLNQFSMDEHDGFLRVATTDNRTEWNEETGEREVEGGNHVIILADTTKELKEVGSVRNLAPGEDVFAARFMGDKGYVVTYEQVDPLFTFDLSNPKNPKMLGELKIEGFSTYIHPLDDGYLLTIGMDADENGRMSGVHLQIFDVTDMNDPKRVQHEVISTGGWSSWSEALHEHHAFTYHDGYEVLAVPMNIYEDNGDHFSGLLVYDVDVNDGFSELGRVAHGDLVDDDTYRWYTRVRRSMFISGDDEEYVYSLSDVGLKVNDLFDPDVERASVKF